jgi:hypothetical protein
MTPKEKAEYLVDEYRLILIHTETDCSEEILCTLIAKQCAIIVVNQIIEQCGKLNVEILHTEYGEKLTQINAEIRTNYTSLVMYWNEVKNEIEKL